MILHNSELFLSSITFILLSICLRINHTVIGLCLIIVPSSALMISGIESIANNKGYFDRGVYQFVNICYMFTGLAFLIFDVKKEESNYIQLAINLFLTATVLKEQESDYLVLFMILTGIVTLNKNTYYTSFMYLVLGCLFILTAVGINLQDHAYELNLSFSLFLILVTFLDYHREPITYEPIKS